MRSRFVESVEVIEFHTTHAYSDLGLTIEKYKINKPLKVENVIIIIIIIIIGREGNFLYAQASRRAGIAQSV
jgi:hypothetical protein